MPPTDQHGPAVRNGLLAALPSEELARLRPKLRTVGLPFDRTLQAADSAVDAALFPESGMVSLLATLDGGGGRPLGGRRTGAGTDRPTPLHPPARLGGRRLRGRGVRNRTDAPATPV